MNVLKKSFTNRALETCYLVQNPRSPARSLADETLVIVPQTRTLHTLNEVATNIWKLADGQHTIANIIEQIVNEFEIDETTARKDVVSFIQEGLDRDVFFLSENPFNDPYFIAR